MQDLTSVLTLSSSFPRMYVDFRDPVHFRSEISPALLCARSRARACARAHVFVRSSLREGEFAFVLTRARAGAAVYILHVSLA